MRIGTSALYAIDVISIEGSPSGISCVKIIKRITGSADPCCTTSRALRGAEMGLQTLTRNSPSDWKDFNSWARYVGYLQRFSLKINYSSQIRYSANLAKMIRLATVLRLDNKLIGM